MTSGLDYRAREGHTPGQEIVVLKEMLKTLGQTDLSSFKRHVYELMGEAYRADFLNVLEIIEPGCTDDSFAYFRQWLILQGKVIFNDMLNNPERLGDFDPTTADFFNEELGSVADEVYGDEMGSYDLPYDGPTGPPSLVGDLLDEDVSETSLSQPLEAISNGDWPRIIPDATRNGGEGKQNGYLCGAT